MHTHKQESADAAEEIQSALSGRAGQASHKAVEPFQVKPTSHAAPHSPPDPPGSARYEWGMLSGQQNRAPAGLRRYPAAHAQLPALHRPSVLFHTPPGTGSGGNPVRVCRQLWTLDARGGAVQSGSAVVPDKNCVVR